jgi:hypothetical protein
MARNPALLHDAAMKRAGTVGGVGREPLNDNVQLRVTSEEWLLKKVCGTLAPGNTINPITHNIGTLDFVVQSRIRNRFCEDGLPLVDENTVEITFAAVLDEAMDVVIIG